MESQENKQVSQDLRNKLNKTLKKAQAPQVPEQTQEQSPMIPEQVQDFKQTLHDSATYRMETLLQGENIKQVLIGIGLELNRIANSLEKFAGAENETQ